MGDAATNDLALVVAVQAGDADAFGVLVTRHTPALLRLVARAVGDADDAEDVVQETFLQAYRALHTFRGEASLGTWLGHIALHRCQERWAKERRRDRIAEARRVDLLWENPDYTVDPVAVAEAAERRGGGAPGRPGGRPGPPARGAPPGGAPARRGGAPDRGGRGPDHGAAGHGQEPRASGPRHARNGARRGRHRTGVRGRAHHARGGGRTMMGCQAARAAVSDYIDGELDPALARMLEEHLRTCGTCPPLYAALVSVRRRLRATVTAPAADAGARMAARVRTQLAGEANPEGAAG